MCTGHMFVLVLMNVIRGIAPNQCFSFTINIYNKMKQKALLKYYHWFVVLCENAKGSESITDDGRWLLAICVAFTVCVVDYINKFYEYRFKMCDLIADMLLSTMIAHFAFNLAAPYKFAFTLFLDISYPSLVSSTAAQKSTTIDAV